MEPNSILITINLATLITIIIATIKVMRFIDKISFKVDMMWRDYERKMNTNLKPAPTFNED